MIFSTTRHRNNSAAETLPVGYNSTILKEFVDIEVTDSLTIELVTTETQPSADCWPIIQAIEIVRQDTAMPETQ